MSMIYRIRYLLFLMLCLLAVSVFSENLSTWQKRMPISFDGYSGDETLINFPALIILEEADTETGFNYSEFLSGDYDDLRFADDNLIPLDFEVESWDPNGKSYVWVRVPELTASTTIYVLWGQEGVSLPSCATDGSVWDASYKSVWHLNENSLDSTLNNKHGTDNNVNPVSGLIAGAYEFPAGKTTYIATPSNFSGYGIADSFTISCWFLAQSEAIQMLMCDGTSATLGGIYLSISKTDNSRVRVDTLTMLAYNDDIHVGLFGSDWHHIALVYDGATVRLYFDGDVKWGPASLTGDLKSGNALVFLGGRSPGNLLFKGLMDEARISSVARSADWIEACIKNQSENADFVNYGAVIQKAAGGTIYSIR
ncbi:MAG: DUF2341 domain-containing protein [Lentisphaerae bacterium]|nr:DUF2341 domain-containing protein [Lentisphaerota bacterium]